MSEENGNEGPELATLMLCVMRLAMRAPELATLMLCVKRLAMRAPELATLMLCVKRLAMRALSLHGMGRVSTWLADCSILWILRRQSSCSEPIRRLTQPMCTLNKFHVI